MEQPRVLLVHYNPRQAESLSHALSEDGFEVHTCSDGQEALATFSEVHPDAVVLEAMIPNRSGFEVCRDLKLTPEGQAVPVVITSDMHRGKRTRDVAMQAYGCQEFLERGFSPAELVSTIRRLLPGAFLDHPLATARLEAQSPDAVHETAEMAATDDSPAAMTELNEGEISSFLDSIFPPSDSGDLATQLAAAGKALTREDFISEEIPDSFHSEHYAGSSTGLTAGNSTEYDADTATGLGAGTSTGLGAGTSTEFTEGEAAEFAANDASDFAGSDEAEFAAYEASDFAGNEEAGFAATDATAFAAGAAGDFEAGDGSQFSAGDLPDFPDFAEGQPATDRSPLLAALEGWDIPIMESVPFLTGATDLPSSATTTTATASTAPMAPMAMMPAESAEPADSGENVEPVEPMQSAASTATAVMEPPHDPTALTAFMAEMPELDSRARFEIEGGGAAASGYDDLALGRGSLEDETAIPSLRSDFPGTIFPTAGTGANRSITGIATGLAALVAGAAVLFWWFGGGGAGRSPGDPAAEASIAGITQPISAPLTGGSMVESVKVESTVPVPVETAAVHRNERGAGASAIDTAAGTTGLNTLPSPPSTGTDSSADLSAGVADGHAGTSETVAPMPQDPAGETPPANGLDPQANNPNANDSAAGAGAPGETAPAGMPYAAVVGVPAAGAGLTHSVLGDASSPNPVVGGTGVTPSSHALVNIGDVDVRPLQVSRPAPAYPIAAKSLRIEGEISLLLLILEDGTVGEVRTIGTHSPILATAARNAAKGWRYTAARKDGVAVRTWINESVSFRLK